MYILFVFHVETLKSFEKQFCRLVACKDVLLDRSRTNLCSIALTLLSTIAFLILNPHKYHICFQIFPPVTFFSVSRNRSSRLQLFFKINVLKNLANFTRKCLCRSLFLIKFQTWMSATSSKTDSSTSVFLSDLWNF